MCRLASPALRSSLNVDSLADITMAALTEEGRSDGDAIDSSGSIQDNHSSGFQGR